MPHASRVRALIFWAAVTAAPQIAGDVGEVFGSDYAGPNGGRWRDPASWRPSGVPGAGGTANVSLAPDGNFLVNMDFRYSLGTALSSVTINSSTSSTLTVNAASDLFSGTETIGDSGLGAYAQSTATNSVSGPLYLGNLASSSGTYNLSGSGSLNVLASEYVGNAGTGFFTQSGGTHTVGDPSISNSSLILGQSTGSSGSYVLSESGSLTVHGYEIIGLFGTGTFTQTGGTHSIDNDLTVSRFGGTGTYSLSGGSLTVNATEYVGTDGTGSFVQSGGTNTVTGDLRFGSTNTGIGNYLLSSTSTLTVNGSERLGCFPMGSGTLTQSNGTHTVNGSEYIGDYDRSTGSLIQTGGTYTVAGNEYVGHEGFGSVSQSGGTHTIGTALVNGQLHISEVYGSTGSYALSASGSLTVTGDEFIGFEGTGIFTQSGGTHTIGLPSANATVLRLGGHRASGVGSYDLSGGQLMVNGNEHIGYSSDAFFPGSGSFTQSGGVQTITGSAFVGGTIAGPGGIGTFNISGGTANIGALKIWDSGDPVPAGTRVNLSGGTLSLGTLDISANPARFNWTGGNLNFTNGLLVDVGGPLGSSINLATGMILSTSGGTLNNLGAITLSGGFVGGSSLLSNSGVISGTGSVGSIGGFSNFGDLTPVGEITLAGNGVNSNFGEMDIAAGNSLRLFGSGLQNMGTIRLSGGIVAGPTQLNNQSGGTITGRGTITALLGPSSGNIALSDGTLNISNPFTNAGVIQLGGLAATLSGGNITNSATIQGFGSVNNTIANTSGTIEAFDGTLILTSPNSTSTGTLAASTNNKLLFTQGLTTNAGLISLAGGTFDNNSKPLTNTAQISGFGIFRSGGLTNNGAITLAGGTTTINGNVINSAGKKIEVRFAPAIFTGAFTNNGIFKSTSAQVTFAGTYTENGQFISDPADNFFQNVTIGPSGSWSGGLGDRFFVSGDLLNNSLALADWQTSAAELDFIGGTLHHFLTGSSDLGNTSFAGFDNNFAWGKLVLGFGDQLEIDSPAAYIGILDLQGGLAQLSSITASGNLYYDLRQPANAWLNGQTYALPGGGSLTPVPEPASLAVFFLAAGISFKRRRQ